MEVRTLLLIFVALLGFLSGLLALVAESKKITENDVIRLSSVDCVHPRSPALVLGLLASTALLIAQVMSNVLGGCICCESGAKDRPTMLAVSFLALSWITFSIAFLLLVVGASVNDAREMEDTVSVGCSILKPGVFTGGALACFTTAVLGVTYNLQVMSIRQGATNNAHDSSSCELAERRSIATSPTRYSVIGQPIFSPNNDESRPVALKTMPSAAAYGNRNLNTSPSGKNLGSDSTPSRGRR